jgi:hypothetical protein
MRPGIKKPFNPQIRHHLFKIDRFRATKFPRSCDLAVGSVEMNIADGGKKKSISTEPTAQSNDRGNHLNSSRHTSFRWSRFEGKGVLGSRRTGVG